MSEQNETPLFPVADWTIGPIEQYGIVAMRLGFLSHPLQKLSESDPGRMYGLTTAQAREIAQKILDEADHLERRVASAPGSPH